jgi:hypothetical protein
VAHEELGRPKVQELLDAGLDLTEVVSVVRVAGLIGSKHAAEPAAHQQIADHRKVEIASRLPLLPDEADLPMRI